MDETKKDIIYAVLTNIKDIMPTVSDFNIVGKYIGRNVNIKNELDLVKAQQEYIACWVNDLADEIIRRS